jgi:transcriptional regulator with XRE-family HTH domain
MNNSNKEKVVGHKESALGANLRTQIKNRMESLGINVRALERKAGLNTGAVNNILNGASANPTAETLNALANAFDCMVDELLGRSALQTSSELEINIDNFHSYQWSPTLYASIVAELNKQIAEKQINITSEKALYIIQEVYLYSLKKHKEAADGSLIDWLLDKYL